MTSIDKVRGMDVIVTTTANTDEEARETAALVQLPLSARAGKRSRRKPPAA